MHFCAVSLRPFWDTTVMSSRGQALHIGSVRSHCLACSAVYEYYIDVIAVVHCCNCRSHSLSSLEKSWKEHLLTVSQLQCTYDISIIVYSTS